MHQRLHNLSEGARGKNKLSGVQCFSIQEGREEMSPESGMVLTDHSPSPEVFCRSQGSKANALARGEEEARRWR